MIRFTFAILRFRGIIFAMKRVKQRETIGATQIDTRHVDVLDGVRALAILCVFWFHLWQQSWLMPYLRMPNWLIQLGLPRVVSFDFIPRSGFLFVDLLLLLSAFCLFLPHARTVFYGEPVQSVAQFYKKRLVRIVPPYYLSVLAIFFLFALPGGAYASAQEACVDLFSTLTFTQTFVPRVLLATRINGVLWTAAVEMQFYVLFPLLARCFRKRPLWTYLGMIAIAEAYLRLFALPNPDGLRATLNQLPAFFGVFANGMLASYAFVWLSTRVGREKRISVPSTAAALLCLFGIYAMQTSVSGAASVQVWQASHRYALSIVFALFLVFAALGARWFRFLFHNWVMTFCAAISYNVYIWHQWIAVQLKQWRIPYWEGEQAPNLTGDKVWQWRYTLLVIFASLAVATLLTYLFERPVSRALNARPLPRPPFFRCKKNLGDPAAIDDSINHDPIAISTIIKERNTTMHHTFTPDGVCASKIAFDLTTDGKLQNVRFTDGCDGNLKAVGKLVEGKDAREIAALLRGNTCGMSATSCADQLARAIEAALLEG